MVRRSDYQLRRRVIVLLLILAGSWQLYLSAYIVRHLAAGTSMPERPFSLITPTNRVGAVDGAAKEAGLRAGDQVIAIQDQPYQGESQVSRMVSRMHPGEVLRVRARHPGQPQDVSMPIPLGQHQPSSGLDWTVGIAGSIITPAFCLLLGFGVLLIRPRDPIAWLLLALMLSFAFMSSSAYATPAAWELPAPWREIALSCMGLFQISWAAWILLFAIYFPERLALDRRFPWIKWLLILPVAGSAVAHMMLAVGEADTGTSLAGLAPLLNRVTSFGVLAGMLSVSGFFGALGIKSGTAGSADARRRINLLRWGASVALTPLFAVAIYGMLRGWDNVPAYLLIPGFLLLAVFPLTLAYVIVVQRALDVRVVVRQGLQYAFARGSARILQGCIAAAVIFGAFTLVDAPGVRRPAKLAIIGLCAFVIINIRRLGERFRTWIDQRFFREAYSAEQLLGELSEKVRTIVETATLLETVARQISRTLHVERVAMLTKSNQGHYETAYTLGFVEPPTVEFDEHAPTVERLKKENEALRIYFDDPDSWIYSEGAGIELEREKLRELDSQLLLPLSYGEKMPGIMSLGPKRSEEPYSNSDVQLLKSVATQTGLALENSHLTQAIAAEIAQRERLNRELEIAREVQERLFPQTHPAVPGLDYAGRCRPALGVGGDYYDFLELPDGQFGLAIGDVSGKGIPAALLMASLQASLRGQAISGPVNLAGMMENLNRLIFDATPSNKYATFFYAQYDPVRRKLAYVNAGHNPPMVLRSDQLIRLDTGGPVIGLFRVAKYQQATVDLQSLDVLVLFTDGISEAMNAQDEEWGEDALEAAARACDGMPAAGMMDRLIENADTFAGGAPQHDDMTIVAVRVE